MVQYRREYREGALVFITFNLKNRRSDLLVAYIDDLKIAIQETKTRYPFEIVALCILPEHVHLVMQLPENQANFSHRVRLIKSLFCQKIAQKISLTKNSRGEYDVWQPRFWEHMIRNELDLKRCVDYVYYNPVKHGWVAEVKNWPYSSFHRDVRRGLLTEDWGCSGLLEHNTDWGE